MEGYWSEILLFISKTVVILVVVVVLLLIFLAVVKGIVAAAVEAKNKKNNDDDMELRIENYGNLLSGEKEKLENSMIKALDDDVYEVEVRGRKDDLDCAPAQTNTLVRCKLIFK